MIVQPMAARGRQKIKTHGSTIRQLAHTSCSTDLREHRTLHDNSLNRYLSMNTLRIAVISSPRSGNTWVRSVLGDILGLQQFAVHNYIELKNIPDRCIVQLHWYREPNLQRFLRGRCFKVLVLARHPLDVLVSMLNFIRHEPLTARWLEGNAEIPKSLAGQSPTSQDFLKYAMSWGAENVLGVTYQWWHDLWRDQGPL